MTASQFQPPSPLDPTALIDSADHAVNNPPPLGASREAIHRAVSTAYYAVFHAICAINADVQHGVPTNPTTAQAWTDTYRQIRHNLATSITTTHLGWDARHWPIPFVNVHRATVSAALAPQSFPEAEHQPVVVILEGSAKTY